MGGIHIVPERDSSGRVIGRHAATIKGWHYQFREFEVFLSKKDGVKSYQGDTLLTDYTCKIFDSNGNEITDQVNEANAVRTQLIWAPDSDYEILGGKLHQIATPVNSVRMSVHGGAVDLGSAYCKYFVPSMNMSKIAPELSMDTDGRASKYMKLATEGIPVPTNKFELNFYYNQGDTHDFCVGFEIFKL